MSQTMLYKLGGDFAYEGELFTYTIVDDENIESAIADGWSLTTTEAIEKGKNPVEVAPVVEAEEADDEPAKRRGRPPKAAE